MSKFLGAFIILATSMILGLSYYYWSDGLAWIGVMMFIIGIGLWCVNWPFRPYPWEDDYG